MYFVFDAQEACSVCWVLTKCHIPGMHGAPLTPGIHELGQGLQEIKAVN